MKLDAPDSISFASCGEYRSRMYIMSNNTCVFMNQFHHQVSLGLLQ